MQILVQGQETIHEDLFVVTLLLVAIIAILTVIAVRILTRRP